RKPVVGIFSREDDSCYRFLSDFLKAQDWVREVRHFTITNSGFQRLQEEASRCHCAVLYHSKNRGRLNITNVTDSLYDEELQDLSSKLGRRNVLVVADDLDRSCPEEKPRILRNQPLIRETAAELFLFSKMEKNDEDLLNEKLQKVSQILRRGNSLPLSQQEVTARAPMVRGHIDQCLQRNYTMQMICSCSRSSRVVGIFSRSSSNDYQWLTTALSSSMFKKCVQESRSICISNRDKRGFREAVWECDFNILYHTKNQGRINITNVTDSLYDDELQYMSSQKGRGNVVVVVDDLEKGDDEEKRRIQGYQPDIVTYAQDLILVTGSEKRQPQLLERKLQQIKALVSPGKWSVCDRWWPDVCRPAVYGHCAG
ncbi:hypothetical protein PRIEUP_LOCUS1519, partial [Pristimantis euphronides]